MQVSVGDQIRVTAGFREGKNVFKNNEIAEVREVTDTELVHAQQGSVASIGDAAWRAQVSVGARPNYTKVEIEVQTWNEA